MATGFRWIKPPSQMAKEVDRYHSRLFDGLYALAVDQAARGQNEMRTGAPWTDRTANARAGLIASAVKNGKKISIFFVHSVFYGVYLELANGGKYQIVWVTMIRNANEFMRRLKSLLAS